VKLHTLLNLRDNIPSFIHISDGKMNEVNVLDILIPEASTSWIGAVPISHSCIVSFRRKCSSSSAQNPI